MNLYEITGSELGNFVTAGYDLCVLITKECDVIPPTKANQTPQQLSEEDDSAVITTDMIR